MEEAYQNWTNAKADVRKGIKQAYSWRQKHKQSLADAIAEAKGTDPEKEKRVLYQQEKQRDQARRIRNIRGKSKGRVTKMYYTEIIPQPNGQESLVIVHECTTPDDMYRAAQQENESRFTQSLVTPSMQEPLLSLIGPLADTEHAEAILAGSFDPPPGLDQYTLLLLQALQ